MLQNKNTTATGKEVGLLGTTRGFHIFKILLAQYSKICIHK
jgi:hypothetical protein